MGLPHREGAWRWESIVGVVSRVAGGCVQQYRGRGMGNGEHLSAWTSWKETRLCFLSLSRVVLLSMRPAPPLPLTSGFRNIDNP
jgi:hypothetical protein